MKIGLWDVVYKGAYDKDGKLNFPGRHTHEYLDSIKRVQGSYIFANQYQNEIIPLDAQSFKKDWFRYYDLLPSVPLHCFIFIDPAIGQTEGSDYTGIVVVYVDADHNWYVDFAARRRLTPTQMIDTMFLMAKTYKPISIGVEDVAFQRSIIHFAQERMTQNNDYIPISGVKRGPDRTKEMRLLALVPYFQNAKIAFKRGLSDLELELLQFPRGSHDDVADALASVLDIVHYPTKEKPSNEPPHPSSPEYESWYIRNLTNPRKQRTFEGDF